MYPHSTHKTDTPKKLRKLVKKLRKKLDKKWSDKDMLAFGKMTFHKCVMNRGGNDLSDIFKNYKKSNG